LHEKNEKWGICKKRNFGKKRKKREFLDKPEELRDK
jgi:hypothetical protein